MRVYGLGLKVERQNEIVVMQLAHSVGAFPKVRGAFNNGVVYEHFPGRIMNYHDLVKPEVIKKLTKKLHDFHYVDGKNVNLVGMRGEPASKDQMPKRTWSMLKEYIIDLIPDEHPDDKLKQKFQAFRKDFPDEVLLEEFNYIQNVLDEMRIPDDALQHGDVHPRNLLINDETGDIVLIDYELTAHGARTQDLGRFIEMKPVLEEFGGWVEKDEPDFTADVRQLWLQTYLETKIKAEGGSVESITEEQIELFDIEVKAFSIIAEFEMIAFCGVPFNFEEGFFNPFGTLAGCTKRYYAQKADLIVLKDRYLQLREKGVNI